MDKAGSAAKLQAKLAAEQIRQMCVAAPNSFAKLVEDASMDSAANKAGGGRLGDCYPTVRSPDFLEAPQIYAEVKKQKLKPGQFSAPIATARGYHIVRVDAVHPEVRAEFEQVKTRVERDYLQEQAKMYTDLWLRALTTQARVKRFLFQSSTAPIIEDLPPDNFTPPK
jgi:parvulin-like peptidyl-prolyl isomerase